MFLAATYGDAAIAIVAALVGVGGALFAGWVHRHADRKRTDPRSAENRRLVREEYLALTGRLAAALEAVGMNMTTDVSRVQDAYEAVQALGRGRVDAAFGTDSAVRWTERQIRSILDGGRRRALQALDTANPAAEQARHELFNYVIPKVADQAIDDLFKREADAAIERPGKVVTEFVSSPDERKELEELVAQYGRDSV